MIDGQQRVTAMMTALSGLEVFNADFEKKHIAIAYNPFAKNDEECFAVQDNAILKDKKWIPDISVIFQTSFDSFSFVQNFCETNPEITPKDFNQQITKLIDIKNRKLGVKDFCHGLKKSKKLYLILFGMLNSYRTLKHLL